MATCRLINIELGVRNILKWDWAKKHVVVQVGFVVFFVDEKSGWNHIWSKYIMVSWFLKALVSSTLWRWVELWKSAAS